MEIDKPKLILSANRALLGAIADAVCAIDIAVVSGELKFIVFANARLNDEAREALEIAATEITSDFSGIKRIDVQFRENVPEPFTISGSCVFLRLGCRIRK